MKLGEYASNGRTHWQQSYGISPEYRMLLMIRWDLTDRSIAGIICLAHMDRCRSAVPAHGNRDGPRLRLAQNAPHG